VITVKRPDSIPQTPASPKYNNPLGVQHVLVILATMPSNPAFRGTDGNSGRLPADPALARWHAFQPSTIGVLSLPSSPAALAVQAPEGCRAQRK
jgi:hypothetical protein